MGLNLQLQALTVPSGTEFPGTVQELLALIAQYEAISGGENFNGVNYGDEEPAPEDRDKAWFKTDGSGNPIGWFAWDGSAWTAIPFSLPSGPTASRPASPGPGQLYLDTDINTTIVYERSQWRTLDGSPGDVKFVTATTLADALTKNPGWSHYTAGIGRVLAGAADGTNPAANTDAGADEITLTEGQLPPHKHTTQGNYGSGGEGGGDNPSYYDAAQAPAVLKDWPDTGLTGDGDPVDVRQATRYLFSLVKD